EGRAPSGALPGRPVVGTRKSTSAGQLLADYAGRDISELRAALTRGRPSGATRELRAVAAVAIGRLRAERKATPDAVAEAFGCDRRTIARLCQQAEDRGRVNVPKHSQ